MTCQLQAVKNDGRVVRLTYVSPGAAQACADDRQGWNLTNLLPGLLVKATIKKVTKHGLLVRFLSSFNGQVDCLHVEPEEASSYAEGSEVKPNLPYVFFTRCIIDKKHILQPCCPSSPLR